MNVIEQHYESCSMT